MSQSGRIIKRLLPSDRSSSRAHFEGWNPLWAFWTIAPYPRDLFGNTSIICQEQGIQTIASGILIKVHLWSGCMASTAGRNRSREEDVWQKQCWLGSARAVEYKECRDDPGHPSNTVPNSPSQTRSEWARRVSFYTHPPIIPGGSWRLLVRYALILDALTCMKIIRDKYHQILFTLTPADPSFSPNTYAPIAWQVGLNLSILMIVVLTSDLGSFLYT